MVEANDDFVDFLRSLAQEHCDFLVVGAYALAAHGIARATGDIDVLVRPGETNAARVMQALIRFGAPVKAHGTTAADFAAEGTVYQLGLPPRRIDLLTSISGVSYDEALADAIVTEVGGERVRCIGREAMIKNKLASGRTKDIADVEALRAVPESK
jgi:hypothetical protein